MSDSVAGSAAWLGGTEIVNDSRTIAYMQNGIKPGTLSVFGDCGCDNILELAGCDDEYTTPDKDNAPWYDPAIPESAEFAGFLTTEFEGLNSTFTRSITESIGNGASLGRSRFGSRTLSWKGFLFGSSCCGVAYGLRWLGKALQGGQNCGNNCQGQDLELLVCCPTMDAALGIGPNIVCNPKFDHDTSFWAASGDSSITWHNRLVFSGEGAMRAVNPVGGAITFNTADCVMSVIPGKTYKLSIRLSGAPGVDPEVVGVTFNWYNYQDSLIDTTTINNIGMDSDDWSLLETTAVPPIGAETVRISFTIGDEDTPANEARYFDEIKLNQLNYAPVVDAFRTLKSVSLMEGPIISEQRKMGSTCGGRCGGSAAMEIEFSLVGAQPWLYSAPIPVVNCVDVQTNSVDIIGGVPSGLLENSPNLVAGASTATSAGFADLPLVNLPNNIYLTLDPGGILAKKEVVLVTSHTAALPNQVSILRGQQGTTAVDHPVGTQWIMQAECGADNCAHGLLASIDGYEGCIPPPLPPSAVYVGCATPDINNWQAIYITAPRAMWNSISEVVPVITINTGGFPLVGARLGFYTSADGNPCGDLINTPPQCDLICDTIYISAIPGNSKFYIDGRTNKMSLICGTNSVFPGEPYTLGPFSWPSFDCYGFCMEFAYDPAYITDELCVSLSLVPRTTL